MVQQKESNHFRVYSFILVLLIFIIGFLSSCATQLTHIEAPSNEMLRFEVSFGEGYSEGELVGRMFVVITRDGNREPRSQVGRYGPQLLGVDFSGLKAGEKVEINEGTLGYPIESLSELPAGEYYVQAMLNKYTKFERADGHTVWMHMDQWEGQNWKRSPGNAYSEVIKIVHEPGKKQVVELEVTEVISPIAMQPDSKYVKRIKMQSKILSDWWGHPMDIGATILLPKGYDEHPEVRYPTVYYQGHFSTRAPLGFNERRGGEWLSDDIARFIAVTIQHPTPYFDDSYAVNSANNGPYGDAIHEELIPEIERRFRCIPESWARVLTGGSTGGWESFALQVFYPDFYGGTWSFAPDPLDFRNVEGINVYEDTNAFYKIHEWYKVPTPNTRIPDTEGVRLTSEQRNRMELVNGTKGRGGQQLDIWSAVFGPVGDDGYFKPLFDKRTGVMDPEVAQYWLENFDLRYYLETNWKEIGPKLVGKLHVLCGRQDNYYLNLGVYHTEEFLESTSDPYYAGSFSYGARGSHGWRPYGSYELLRMMAEHITKNAPAGADTDSWKY